ncbi:MAG: histidine kinase N-terminal 7TM domain-containing protein [bacterium]|nr:histidine kinase N-terminal 7TM domain-containing protein [bacterium]
MGILLVVTIVGSLACLLLAVYVYKADPKNNTNRYFSLFIVIQIFLLISLFFSITTNLLYLIRVAMLFVPISVVTLFLFSYSYTIGNLDKKLLYFFLSISSICSLLAVSPYLFTEVISTSSGFIAVAGTGMIFFAPYVVITSILTFGILTRNLRDGSHIKRQQSQFIILGLIVNVGSMFIFNFFIVNILKTTAFIPFGMCSVLFFLGSTAYAITRYRFLDIRIVFKKTVVYGFCLIAGMAIIAGLLLTFFQDVRSIYIWLAALVLIIVIWDLYKRQLKKILDNIFFANELDISKRLDDRAKQINSTPELDKFVERSVSSIEEMIKAQVKGVFILEREHQRLKSYYPANKKYYLQQDGKIIDALTVGEDIIVLDELLAENNSDKTLEKFLVKNDSDFILIIADSDQVYGIILMNKLDVQNRYSAKDISNIKELSLAIKSQLPTILFWHETVQNLKDKVR